MHLLLPLHGERGGGTASAPFTCSSSPPPLSASTTSAARALPMDASRSATRRVPTTRCSATKSVYVRVTGAPTGAAAAITKPKWGYQKAPLGGRRVMPRIVGGAGDGAAAGDCVAAAAVGDGTAAGADAPAPTPAPSPLPLHAVAKDSSETTGKVPYHAGSCPASCAS
jgi:hypothetical protein